MATKDQLRDLAATGTDDAVSDATLPALRRQRREQRKLAEGGSSDDAQPVSRRDFMRRVSLRLGNDAPSAEPVLLAVLEELGRALDAGEALSLPPLGRLRVAKGSPEQGRQYTIKLRRPKSGDDAADLAEPKVGGRREDDDDGGDDM